jgi:hypothetical protein
VLSKWPRTTELKLQKKWTYSGRQYAFAKGRYRWYVWPGFGARAATNYGKLLGSSHFVAK